MRKDGAEVGLALGAVCLGLAGLLLFVWIPLDTETGIIERVRGRQAIGDALAPAVAAFILALGGLLLCAQGWLRPDNGRLDRRDAGFLIRLIAIVAVSFALIRWSGPALAYLMADGADYRTLRDSAPWKYVGYGLGGVFLVFAIITLIEREWRWRRLLIAAAVAAACMLIYDLPFDDLLLPPNGDV